MKELTIDRYSIDFSMQSLDESAIEKIQDGMIEQGRILNAFSRTNSQTTLKLMSLTMLSEGPYRRLRQCAAEIDRKRKALAEAAFAMRKRQVDLDEASARLELLDLKQFVRRRTEIEISEHEYWMEDARISMEAALKDIAALQDAYEQIRILHDIPGNWDETHFEAAEVKAHVMTAFRLGYSDISAHTRLSASAIEYFQQFGIHPYSAARTINEYLNELHRLHADGKVPTIDHFYQFLEAAATQYEDCYKAAMRHIGLTDLTTTWCQYREALK